MKMLENNYFVAGAMVLCVMLLGAIVYTLIYPDFLGVRRIGGYYISSSYEPQPGYSLCISPAGQWVEKGTACHTDPGAMVDSHDPE